jgi:hypothetical protein
VDEATRTGGQALGDGRRGPAEIRADIERTREELGETVEALAAKTDVKAHAQDKLQDTRQRALNERARAVAHLRRDPRPFVRAAVIAAGLLLVSLTRSH